MYCILITLYSEFRLDEMYGDGYYSFARFTSPTIQASSHDTRGIKNCEASHVQLRRSGH